MTNVGSFDNREFSDEVFHSILRSHWLWLDSEHKEGKKADYSNVDFGGNITILRNQRLDYVNLEGARLRRMEFGGASLKRTQLANSDLSEANLTECRGLISSQLAGANVSGAHLPKLIEEFGEVERANRLATICSRLFVILLTGCLYTLMTIGGTTDVALLTNSGIISLPLSGTHIQIVGFYFAAPLLLFGAYIYFQIYLLRLFEALYRLPAFFPDGRPLDSRVSPWFVISLTRWYVDHLKLKPPPLTNVQVMATVVLGWMATPITILLIWFRYLTRHDWVITNIHIVVLTAIVYFGFVFFWSSKSALTGKPWYGQLSVKDNRFGFRKLITILVSVGALVFISLGAIEGKPWDGIISYSNWVSGICRIMNYEIFANFSDQAVSQRPDYWFANDEVSEAQVNGADLKNRNLRYVNASNAFFINSNLNDCDLENGNLESANLRLCRLRNSNLMGTNLTNANLRNTDLSGAIVRGSILLGADFTGARLDKTDLRNTDLSGTTGINDVQLKSAIFDSTTILPEYFD